MFGLLLTQGQQHVYTAKIFDLIFLGKKNSNAYKIRLFTV